MLIEIESSEAKAKFSVILGRVEAGEAFTITSRGNPIADIIPSSASRRVKVEVAIANILRARRHKLNDEILDELRRSYRK